MRRRGVWLAVSLVAMGLSAWSSDVRAEEGGTPAAGGERRERRRRFDPERMRQRFNERIKERLGATDDEWQVLQPRLTKVMELRRNANTGSMRMLFGRRGRRGRRGRGSDRAGASGAEARPAQGGRTQRPDRPQREPSEVRKKAGELSTTLEKKDATPDEIKAKLTALRTARDAARAELAKAQQQLREIVTQRQEAMLVLMGMLD